MTIVGEKTNFVMKKTHRVIKKNIFRQLRHHRRCIDKKKFEKRKKKFCPILDLKGWWSRDHVTPNISAQGWKLNKPYGDVE